jgi:hypothetical protein
VNGLRGALLLCTSAASHTTVSLNVFAGDDHTRGTAAPAPRSRRGVGTSSRWNPACVVQDALGAPRGVKPVGRRAGRRVVRHILPNVFAPIAVIASVWLGKCHRHRGSPELPGTRHPPADPDLGRHAERRGATDLETAPYLAIFPGLAISIVVLAFNMLGAPCVISWILVCVPGKRHYSSWPGTAGEFVHHRLTAGKANRSSDGRPGEAGAAQKCVRACACDRRRSPASPSRPRQWPGRPSSCPSRTARTCRG